MCYGKKKKRILFLGAGGWWGWGGYNQEQMLNQFDIRSAVHPREDVNPGH